MLTSSSARRMENMPDCSSKVLHFFTRNVYQTQKDDMYKLKVFVEISLSYRARFPVSLTRSGLKLVYFRSLRFSMSVQSFPVIDFRNLVSGKLLMVNSDLRLLGSAQVGLKLKYLNSSSTFDSLVNVMRSCCFDFLMVCNGMKEEDEVVGSPGFRAVLGEGEESAKEDMVGDETEGARNLCRRQG
nr:hypothetical protein DM860_001954 [Ipomoea batatas]